MIPRTLNIVLSLLLAFLLFSCATPPQQRLRDHALVVATEETDDAVKRHAPVFVIEQSHLGYNRIGEVKADVRSDRERVFIDPNSPVVYYSSSSFSTPLGNYTNLFYRVHFSEVPSGIVPFYLGAGKNVGLFVIVTLDSSERPVLYTTVHTCGCYLAFMPTTHLDRSSWPKNWSADEQYVYGETLPGLLRTTETEKRLVLLLRSATHRVKDAWLENGDEVETFRTVVPVFRHVDELERVPLASGGVTSFYETQGPRKGYVKDSEKVWERLLISWWALDSRVGEDKKLGKDVFDGIVFYTSIKPWAREESDLRNFPRFLRYWGWQL